MSDDQSESSVVPTDVPSSGIDECNSITTVPSCSQSEVSCVGDATAGRGPDDLSEVSTDVKFDPIAVIQRKCIEEKLAKNYSLPYPTPIFYEDLHPGYVHYKSVQREKMFHLPIQSFGWSKFMSYAAHFCKYEARNGAEIVSVGSGGGCIDREIIARYREHFGEEMEITLIDPKPGYDVHFKTVKDLIEERPNVVRNCVVFIIWPEPTWRSDGYDIDAILKLQPLAVLTVYDPNEISGSERFLAFLHRETKEPSSECHPDSDEFGLDNYKVADVVRQEVYFRAGVEYIAFDECHRRQPATLGYSMRLVRLRRTD